MDQFEELRQVYSAFSTGDLLEELRNRGLRADGVRCLHVCLCMYMGWINQVTD